MSGLSKPRRSQDTKFVAVTAAEIAPIDPLLELTQPGGPYPPGHAIVTDGMGGYVIESTLRPYFLSFALDRAVPKLGYRWLKHHGIETDKCGPVIPVSLNLVATSISTDFAISRTSKYSCEIMTRDGGSWDRLVTFDIVADDARRTVITGLSVHIPARSELGLRITQTDGARKSKFDNLICLLELEN